MTATKSVDPPLKHTPFTENLPDGSQKVTNFWYDWALNLALLFKSGVTTTVPLAKLTGGGTAGSLTIVKGVITSVVEPT